MGPKSELKRFAAKLCVQLNASLGCEVRLRELNRDSENFAEIKKEGVVENEINMIITQITLSLNFFRLTEKEHVIEGLAHELAHLFPEMEAQSVTVSPHPQRWGLWRARLRKIVADENL